jgi:hypothetical protein
VQNQAPRITKKILDLWLSKLQHHSEEKLVMKFATPEGYNPWYFLLKAMNFGDFISHPDEPHTLIWCGADADGNRLCRAYLLPYSINTQLPHHNDIDLCIEKFAQAGQYTIGDVLPIIRFYVKIIRGTFNE